MAGRLKAGMTPKQEAFAQSLVTGLSQSDAYRVAFNVRPNTKPETVNQAASRLMADSNISARVAELRKPVAQKAQITLESHLQRLQDLSEKAERSGNLSAAITAEIARGKASGVHVEKTESTVTTRELPSSVNEFV